MKKEGRGDLFPFYTCFLTSLYLSLHYFLHFPSPILSFLLSLFVPRSSLSSSFSFSPLSPKFLGHSNFSGLNVFFTLRRSPQSHRLRSWVEGRRRNIFTPLISWKKSWVRPHVVVLSSQHRQVCQTRSKPFLLSSMCDGWEMLSENFFANNEAVLCEPEQRTWTMLWKI